MAEIIIELSLVVIMFSLARELINNERFFERLKNSLELIQETERVNSEVLMEIAKIQQERKEKSEQISAAENNNSRSGSDDTDTTSAASQRNNS